VWGHIGERGICVRPECDPQLEDVWMFSAIDVARKVVPILNVGVRDSNACNALMGVTAIDLADSCLSRTSDTDGTSGYSAIAQLCHHLEPQEHSLFRISEPMLKLEPKKIGRPTIPNGTAEKSIVPKRTSTENRKRVGSAAKADNQNVSLWIRSMSAAAKGFV